MIRRLFKASVLAGIVSTGSLVFDDRCATAALRRATASGEVMGGYAVPWSGFEADSRAYGLGAGIRGGVRFNIKDPASGLRLPSGFYLGAALVVFQGGAPSPDLPRIRRYYFDVQAGFEHSAGFLLMRGYVSAGYSPRIKLDGPCRDNICTRGEIGLAAGAFAGLDLGHLYGGVDFRGGWVGAPAGGDFNHYMAALMLAVGWHS